MTSFSNSETTIRPLEKGDLAGVLEMVRELAAFEHLSDQAVATKADYEEAFFGDSPTAEALVAEKNEGLVGYAIFFRTFSSFVGKPGLWLEDLYVRPDHRRVGIGKELLKTGARIAAERGYGRYEWAVLDWNQTAISVYTSVGGELLDEWRIVRMNRAALENFTYS
ncbi:MAG: GNAT family N-acetyltransferase [Verrucomicrobiota bacterium]